MKSMQFSLLQELLRLLFNDLLVILYTLTGFFSFGKPLLYFSLNARFL